MTLIFPSARLAESSSSLLVLNQPVHAHTSQHLFAIFVQTTLFTYKERRWSGGVRGEKGGGRGEAAIQDVPLSLSPTPTTGVYFSDVCLELQDHNVYIFFSLSVLCDRTVYIRGVPACTMTRVSILFCYIVNYQLPGFIRKVLKYIWLHPCHEPLFTLTAVLVFSDDSIAL